GRGAVRERVRRRGAGLVGGAVQRLARGGGAAGREALGRQARKEGEGARRVRLLRQRREGAGAVRRDEPGPSARRMPGDVAARRGAGGRPSQRTAARAVAGVSKAAAQSEKGAVLSVPLEG